MCQGGGRADAQQASHRAGAILQQRERSPRRGAAGSDLHQSRRDALAPYNASYSSRPTMRLTIRREPSKRSVYVLATRCVGMGPALDESDMAAGPWLCAAGGPWLLLLLMSREANCKD